MPASRLSLYASGVAFTSRARASRGHAGNQRFLDDAAKLLSASDFVAIFGVPPGTKVDLVVADPTRASPGTP
jgi:hypothetical protein